MTTTDLTSIPLPVEPSVAVTARKTERDMLQEALKEHKTSSSGKESNSSSKHTSVKPGNTLAPKNSIAGNAAAGETSQSIVDELFKDFIAQKLKSVSRRTSDETAFSGRRSSADAINEILDMEIQSIKTHTENKDGPKSQEKLVHKKHHSSEAIPKQPGLNYSSISLGQKINSSFQKETEPSETFNNHSTVSRESSLSAETKKNSVNEVRPQASSGQNSSAADGENSSAPENVGPVNDNTLAALSPAVQQKEKEPPQFQNVNNAIIKKNVMLPTQLARKLMPPKLLGVKLSTESLSLIQSTDRIDRNGRVWEEGEVQSSNSEESEKEIVKSDSEPDDLPSDSGSIHSNSEGSKISSSKHKKKHRHKHKRKRKKSAKEKDKESNERESKDRSRDKNKGKYKDSITKDKDKHKSHSKSDGGSDKRSSKDRDESLRSGSKEGEKCEVGQSEQVKEKSSSDREHEGMKKKDRKRKRSHSRSRSPQRQKRSRSRSHSRSRSPKRHGRRSSSGSYYSEWDARRYSDDPSKFSSKDHSRSRSRSKEKHRRSRDRSRSRERSQSKERKTRDLRLQIDKAKLRKIAITNALQNMRMGQGPQVDLTVLKSGGKSVEELTEFCKKISEKSKAGAKSDSGSDEDATKNSDDEDILIHHPFKVKEASTSSIVMNIRNAKQLPVLTPSEKQVQQAALRLTFPVSSGSHHRANESEWVPVVKTPPAAAAAAAAAPAVSSPMPTSSQVILESPAVEEQRKPDSIFPDPAEAQKIDISSVISERLQAVRKLQENPYDIQALNKMHQIQEQASMWATSKHLPGQFVGSTGAHVLSQEELIGDKRHQAWAKKAQMTQAAPVNGGIGMFLLQKMGWKQGEGLGKNNEGSKVPLLLDVKVDRRGLTTAAENPRSKTQVVAGPRPKDLSNKHPVSALMELCNRRRWGPPLFTVVQESGPDHKKCFLFKVRVNNIEYQPAIPSSNKKMAKAQCAAVCLQEMGLIPRDTPLNI